MLCEFRFSEDAFAVIVWLPRVHAIKRGTSAASIFCKSGFLKVYLALRSTCSEKDSILSFFLKRDTQF